MSRGNRSHAKATFAESLIYNPPEKSPYRLSEGQLDNIFQFLSIETKGNILLFGDFNLPKMDWNTYYSSDSYENDFVSRIIDMSLKQVVNFKTTKSPCLDLIFCENESNIIRVDKAIDIQKFSNHSPVEIESQIRKPKLTSNVFYSFCNFESLKPR